MTLAEGRPTPVVAVGLLATLAAATGGLALNRLLYEALFPIGWLGRPAAALASGITAGILGALLSRRLARRRGALETVAPFLPLFLNLTWLLDPAVDPVRSRLLFAAGLWLAGAIALLARDRPGGRRLAWAALGLAAGALYLLTMPPTVGRADTFEFQVVVPRLGIVHPTGYPLYLLLGKLLTTVIPAGNPALRLNVVTMLYGLLALGATAGLGEALGGKRATALAGAAALALTPTFWSQAIEAEVYTLHLLFVGGALWLMAWLLAVPAERFPRIVRWLPLLLGLSLTNHLTSLILLPPAALLLFWRRDALPRRPGYWLGLLVLFLAPLLLYGYLPWRWAAVNGEPMGAARFLDWVVGGRFQGALRPFAALSDPARLAVVGRLFLSEWGAFGLLWAALGWLALARRQPRAAALVGLAWAGFTAYALSYYVPDLAVFLLPAQLIVAAGWGAAPLWLLSAAPTRRRAPVAAATIALMALALPLLGAADRWSALDRSADDGLTTWGRAVLTLPLPEGAAILADSEKIAPLYYLQQVEGIRPDLDILVLPDEAAYRAELGARLANGQAVFLARFLPGLEGQFHLRSLGPLLEVSPTPLVRPPADLSAAGLDFADVQLLGYSLETVSPFDPDEAALTLAWSAPETPAEVLLVYVRWGDPVDGRPLPPAGRHAAGNNYPTVAWQPGEVVLDFHSLPRPVLPEAAEVAVQVALAPPFTPAEALPWQTLLVAELPPTDPARLDVAPVRALLGPVALSGVAAQPTMRPGATTPVLITGRAQSAGARNALTLSLQPHERTATSGPLTVPLGAWGTAWALTRDVEAPGTSGWHDLMASATGTALCGWLQSPRAACPLAAVDVGGVPLPAGASNFADQIALLDLTVSPTDLSPGGGLSVDATWQALAPLENDYTVFVQVLDARDRIVAQTDTWPLQGTYPTSRWRPGEVVRDRYTLTLDAVLPPGDYRLIAGWYLLGTLQRLPVLDEAGDPVADRVVVTGLSVPGPTPAPAPLPTP